MTSPLPRPRILYFIDSLAVGGAERSLVDFAREFRALGVDLHVAYLRPRAPLANELESAGARLHPIPGPQRRISWIRQARRLLRELQPDVIHTSLFEADIVGRIASTFTDVPVVSSFVTESWGPEHVSNLEYRRWKVRAAHAVDLLSARRVDRFHAVSDSIATLMSRRLWLDRDRIEVVPRGRDPKVLGERTVERGLLTRERIGLDPATSMVLAVARHHHVKGLDTLIAAFPQVLRVHPETVLFIAGREGPATEALLSMTVELGIESSVVLAGLRNDVFDLTAAADVFVLPSRVEGSPGALIEAMALRVPVVASDIPSVREIAGSPPVVELFPLDDQKTLTDAVVRLLDDKELGSSLAAAAHRRFVAHFTLNQTARRMMGVYSRALKQRGAKSRPAWTYFDEIETTGGEALRGNSSEHLQPGH